MAKVKYEHINYHKDTLAKLAHIDKITEKYMNMGYKLTVRQLFYQLVVSNRVPNNANSYDNTAELIKKGRMTGHIDWNSIEDRTRIPVMSNPYHSVSEFLHEVAKWYLVPRWDDQPHYVEVMVEKEALVGILEPVALEYGVTLLSNKGYSSASAMHEAARRIKKKMEGKICHILYLGDHDPSGVDMTRDIIKRLTGFGCKVEVERIALTREQVEEYNPPPNQVKYSDSRTLEYVKRHGIKSWELDALNPQSLQDILRKGITKYLDLEKYGAMLDEEELGRRRLGFYEEEAGTMEEVEKEMEEKERASTQSGNDPPPSEDTRGHGSEDRANPDA